MRKRTKQRRTTTDPALMGLRTHKDSLQSAVNTFKHPDGRTVTLVGVEHIGEPGYFTQLRTVIDATVATGAQVRREGLLDSEDASDARSASEREGLTAVNAQLNIRFKPYTALGLDWVGDKHGLPSEPTWIHSDIKNAEMVRMLGPARLARMPQLVAPQRQLAEINALKAKKAYHRLRWMRIKLVDDIVKRGTKCQKGTLHQREHWWDTQTFYAFRERCEALKLLEQDGDVVLLWNPAHLRGFSEALLRNEFAHTESQWLTVLKAPSYYTPVPID
jgi:hypothetical protein